MRREYGDAPRRSAATPLPALARRAHLRVVVPPSVSLYACVGSLRCVVADIGAGGAALRPTESPRGDLPRPGQEVQVALDHDGDEATTAATVARCAPGELAVAFPRALRDDEVNVPLLLLLARLQTRRIDRRSAGGRFLYESFAGAGGVELRLQAASPAWWQLVFLDYVVAWSEGGQVATGRLDRVAAAVVWHERAWASLQEVAALVTARCKRVTC